MTELEAGIVASDQTLLTDFYERAFGFVRTSRLEFEGVGVVQKLRRGAAHIKLFAPDPTATDRTDVEPWYASAGWRYAALYLESARFDPTVAGRMYGNIGILHAMRSDWPAALDWFGRAERLSPGDPMTAYNTGSAYARMGRRADAIAAFERALSVDPRYEPALRALAMMR